MPQKDCPNIQDLQFSIQFKSTENSEFLKDACECPRYACRTKILRAWCLTALLKNFSVDVSWNGRKESFLMVSAAPDLQGATKEVTLTLRGTICNKELPHITTT